MVVGKINVAEQLIMISQVEVTRSGNFDAEK